MTVGSSLLTYGFSTFNLRLIPSLQIRFPCKIKQLASGFHHIGGHDGPIPPQKAMSEASVLFMIEYWTITHTHDS